MFGGRIMRNNAKKVLWDIIKIKNKLCYFTDFRIDRSSIPEGFNMYEVADCCDGVPSYLAKGILVNFYGTIITKEEFDLEGRYCDFDKDEWQYQSAKYFSLSELLDFIKRGELK